MNTVRLQGVLKSEYQGTPGHEKILDALASLRMAYTGGGRATVSAEMGKEHFEQCFGKGIAPEQGSRVVPGPGQDNASLPVPDALRPYFDNLSLQPQHEQFRSEI